MPAAAALMGAAIAWLRPDLDLRPRKTGAEAAALTIIFASILTIAGMLSADMAILFATLASLSVIDLRRKMLPDPLTLPLIAIGLTAGILVGTAVGLDRAIGAAVGYFVLRGLDHIWQKYRGVTAMGQGDAKLFAAIGAFLGWQALPEVALIASVAAILIIAISGPIKGTREMPFGPALAFGALLWVSAGPFLT